MSQIWFEYNDYGGLEFYVRSGGEPVQIHRIFSIKIRDTVFETERVSNHDPDYYVIAKIDGIPFRMRLTKLLRKRYKITLQKHVK